MHTGRAALGGDREVALTCFAMARLAAGLLPPFVLAPADSGARTAAAKQWVASLALPAPARNAAIAVIDAVSSGNRRSAGTALKHLSDIASRHLDQSSLNELTAAASELSVS